MKIKIEVVVTRHPALVEYLRELGLVNQDIRILKHATPEDVRGKHVAGVLPHSLSSLCASFTEIPLTLPQELRSVELSVSQIREFAGSPVIYIVWASCPSCGKKFSDSPACAETGGVH